jgi:hypothetical protein
MDLGCVPQGRLHLLHLHRSACTIDMDAEFLERIGSMNDTNEKCSQNDASLDLVCTPLEISPIIESNG